MTWREGSDSHSSRVRSKFKSRDVRLRIVESTTIAPLRGGATECLKKAWSLSVGNSACLRDKRLRSEVDEDSEREEDWPLDDDDGT